jgi:hypothetical protein
MTMINVSMRPSIRPSLRPTFVPSSHVTLTPTLTRSFVTEPPTTQRSATVYPRLEAATRHDAEHLLGVLRMNVEFLASLLPATASRTALASLEDIHTTIDRLEHRVAKSPVIR